MSNDVITQEIPLDRHFIFPNDISVKWYRSYILVISTETANWLVLENEEQLYFFELLKSNTLEVALTNFKGSLENAEWVVTQIIAKEFECKDVQHKSNQSSLHLYLTNACNMHCPHCYMSAGTKHEDELTNEEINQLIDQSHKNGISHIVFSGGEATIHPNLKDFIERAHSLQMEIELLTNGTLLNEEAISSIAFMLSRVQISIDGYSDETNSKVRGIGNFDKALNTIELLVKNGVKTDIGITPPFSMQLHQEVGKYVEFVNMLKEKYQNKVGIAFTSELFDGRELNLTKEQKLYYRNCVNQICENLFGSGFKDQGFIGFHNVHGIDDNCAYGNITVSSNGDVYFCSQITPMRPLANIRTLPYTEIFAQSKLAKERSNINNVKPCGSCELKYICGGDCRIIYFSSLLDSRSTEIAERECSSVTKDSIYQLMIDTNEYLFK